MSGKNKKKSSAKPKKAAAEKCSAASYRNKILMFLGKHEKKYMLLGELEKKCRTKKYGKENFSAAFEQLRSEGIIVLHKNVKVGLCLRLRFFPAEIVRLSRTFGFAKTDKDIEYFIPGNRMLGAMPGDRVLISEIESRTGEPEGEVVEIISFGKSELTGSVEFIDGEYYLVPDTASANHIKISCGSEVRFAGGDKVLAKIVYRGRRHAEHKVEVTKVFGNADCSASCIDAILAAHGVPDEFPADVQREAVKIAEGGVQVHSLNNREDLRDMNIFTIDSAESKDLDDAVSVERTDRGYLLGVHIADVSHYVKGNSALDKEAMKRGTSIYYADKVIPMLPKELSNGVCSLNPGEDRLTLSAFIDLDCDGNIISYRFCKSAIRSRVKGIYSEINSILAGCESHDTADKYACVRDEIPLMDELADILIKKRRRRHAPELETVESKLFMDENDVCVGAAPRERGKSERIIEEFMLTANEAAARLAREKNIPFVYRVHLAPPAEKTMDLKEYIPKFGIKCPNFTEFRPVHAEEIIENARGTEFFEAVNMMVLRSMSKAEYSPEPQGHFGLALDDYAHFTSPIRRYPDLAIHRIITDVLAGYNIEWLARRYGGFAVNAAERSSKAEVRAVAVERECEDCCKAEYMKAHIGESFTGRISSVTGFGFYVILPDTAEGLVHIRSLPEGEYDYSYPVSLTEKFSGATYRLGDEVRVICAAVNVSEGNIDFVLEDDENEV